MPEGPDEVGIFWDYGSCSVPEGLTGFTVVNNIRSLALQFGRTTSFKAYLSVSEFASSNVSRNVKTAAAQKRSELQCSGVSLTDVSGGKDLAAMLIVDVLSYAFDRPADSTVVVLISADPALAYAVSTLRLRNYDVVVVSPSNSNAKSDLSIQASSSYDWNVEIIQKFDTCMGPSTASTKEEDRARPGAFTQGRKIESKRPVVDLDGGRKPNVICPRAVEPSTSLSDNQTDSFSSDDEAARKNEDRSGLMSSSSSRGLYKPPKCVQVDQSWRKVDLKKETTGRLGPNSGPISPPQPMESRFDIFRRNRTPDFRVAGASSSTSPPPAEGQTQTSGQPTEQPERRIPPEFLPLVQILGGLREAGQIRPLRSQIGSLLLQTNYRLYEMTGHGTFALYAAKAETLRLVEMGRKDGSEWIRLHPSVRC